MNLSHASRRVLDRGTCLRSSYVEISQFFRTRSHGITPSCAAAISRQATRCLSTSRPLQDAIEPNEQLRKTLDEFKATSMSS